MLPSPSISSYTPQLCRQALAKLGFRLTRSEAEAIVAKFDTDGDGYIDVREFHQRIRSGEGIDGAGGELGELVLTETDNSGRSCDDRVVQYRCRVANTARTPPLPSPPSPSTAPALPSEKTEAFGTAYQNGLKTPGPTAPGLSSERTEAYDTAYQSGLKTPAGADAMKTPVAPRTVATTFQTPNTGVRGGTGFAPGRVSYEQVVAESEEGDGYDAGGEGGDGDEVEVRDEQAGAVKSGELERDEQARLDVGRGQKSVERSRDEETGKDTITPGALASLHKQIEDAMSKIQGPIETMAAQEKEQLSDMSNLVEGLRSEVKRVTAEQQKSQQLQVRLCF